MPMTPESDAETVEEQLEAVRDDLQEQLEEIIIARPLKAIAVAFVAGIVIGKLVL